MSEANTLTRDSVPNLLPGVMMKHDEIRERTVLLAPERTLALDGTGIAIIEAIDGKSTVSEIVHELAKKYDAEVQTIGNDVVAFLRDLINRGYVGFTDGG
ncbi:MAG: pyrroloquinoline quinone biosynthesis peptide chaperone PqqD [Rhizobiaceae bacterium]|nr:pyrroloquinoline quinone biosynthesis peptide chaperone PqqD [Rhizobiaceae bacterium]